MRDVASAKPLASSRPATSACSHPGSATVSLLRNASRGARYGSAGIVAPGKATILRQPHDTNRWVPIADVRNSAVGGGIVDEDRLDAHALLRGNGVETGVEMLPSVPGHHDHRHVGLSHTRRVTLRRRRCAASARQL